MENTAKHGAQQPQHQEEPAKKKSRKGAKAKHTTPPPNNEAEAEPPPMASSSAIEITKASDSSSCHKALGLSDLPCHAAQEAFNEIVKAQAIFQNEFKSQSLRNNTAAMVQMLVMTAATVPFDSHDLLKARDKLTGGAQAQCTGPSSAAPQQSIWQGRPKPNASLISRTLCAWGRHARTRIPGLTVDATGRLSLQNIMRV